MKFARIGCLFLVLGLCVTPAEAGLIIAAGNNPPPGVENIHFNLPGLVTVGDPVTGLATNSQLVMFFTGSEGLITSQHQLAAVDGRLRDVEVTLPGGTFADYIFDLRLVERTTGTATITANAVGESFAATFAIGNGANFFTVRATDAHRLVSVEILSSVDLSDVRQHRISGARRDVAASTPGPSIPEPASLLLVGTGIAVMQTRRRHRA